MSNHTEMRWVITQDKTLYTGQWLRRHDAIHEHVAALLGPWPPVYRGKGLTDDERTKWRQLQRQGHRAVLIPITFPVSDV